MHILSYINALMLIFEADLCIVIVFFSFWAMFVFSTVSITHTEYFIQSQEKKKEN